MITHERLAAQADNPIIFIVSFIFVSFSRTNARKYLETGYRKARTKNRASDAAMTVKKSSE